MRGTAMPLRLLAIAAVISVVVIDSPAGNAGPLVDAATAVPQAPIGHLQPRASRLSSGSAAEQIEQEQMSTFDAEQHKLDEQLDRSLNICKC
jgi:hypothetical protein